MVITQEISIDSSRNNINQGRHKNQKRTNNWIKVPEQTNKTYNKCSWAKGKSYKQNKFLFQNKAKDNSKEYLTVTTGYKIIIMIIIMINKNGFGRTERARIAFQCIHSKCRVLYRSSYVSYIHMVLLLYLMSTLNTRTKKNYT